MKRTINSLVAIVCVITLVLAIPLTSFAATNAYSSDDLKQVVDEVNEFLATHSQPIELKNQKCKQIIPLSNGENAVITTELKKIETPTPFSDLLDAKVGYWDLSKSYDLGLNTTGTISCKLNVSYVPSSPDGTMPKFQCSSPSIYAVPGHGYTVKDKGIELKVITPDYEYSMPGYVQLAMGNVIINHYPTMDVVFAGNTENTFNKIQVDFYFR